MTISFFFAAGGAGSEGGGGGREAAARRAADRPTDSTSTPGSVLTRFAFHLLYFSPRDRTCRARARSWACRLRRSSSSKEKEAEAAASAAALARRRARRAAAESGVGGGGSDASTFDSSPGVLFVFSIRFFVSGSSKGRILSAQCSRERQRKREREMRTGGKQEEMGDAIEAPFSGRHAGGGGS